MKVEYITDYCDKHDVCYNKTTGEFTETGCKDKNCDFCKNKPKKLSKKYCKSKTCELIDGSFCKGMKLEDKK